MDEYRYIRHFANIGSLVGGWINNIGDKFIFVSLDSLDDIYTNKLSGKYGVYPLIHQPKPERGRYKQGDYHFFYVVSVDTVIVNESYFDVKTILSRRSKKLPVLIMQKCFNDDKITKTPKIKCIKREAGLCSVMKADSKIPKQYIEYTSDLLGGEKIRFIS